MGDILLSLSICIRLFFDGGLAEARPHGGAG